MNRIAGRAWITVVLAGLLVIGFVFFLWEFSAKSDGWVMEEGSPHIYEGERIICSVVTDRTGTLLLDSTGEGTYSNRPDLRSSTVHWVGDREGNVDDKLLHCYSDQIAGFDLLNGVYNYGDKPGVIRLTLSADAQIAALEAMGDYKGTVAVYNYKTGEILCAVSTPGFDPDNLPDLSQDESGELEGVYVNRFTQSQFTPGSIFKIVTTAVALETIPGVSEQRFSCSGTLAYGPDNITCEIAHGEQDLQTAFCNSCNCYFAQLSQLIGGVTLQEYVEKFGLISSMPIDGICTEPGNFATADAAPVNVAWGAVGQYTDLINPASFLSFVGAVANGGAGMAPYMVQDIKIGNNTTYTVEAKCNERILSEETAATLQTYMGYAVTNKYGSDKFPPLGICAKTGTAEVGGEKKPNAMLTGFSTDPEHPYAFVVCVEDAGYGKVVCIPIASRVLNACMQSNSPMQ